jgi:hypothetical protein
VSVLLSARGTSGQALLLQNGQVLAQRELPATPVWSTAIFSFDDAAIAGDLDLRIEGADIDIDDVIVTTTQGKAQDPVPADGAVGVRLQAVFPKSGLPAADPRNQLTTVLQWFPGEYAGVEGESIIYVSDDRSAVEARDESVRFARPFPRLALGFAPATTYFWRVDTLGSRGLVEGDIWTFTTAP